MTGETENVKADGVDTLAMASEAGGTLTATVAGVLVPVSAGTDPFPVAQPTARVAVAPRHKKRRHNWTLATDAAKLVTVAQPRFRRTLLQNAQKARTIYQSSLLGLALAASACAGLLQTARQAASPVPVPSQAKVLAYLSPQASCTPTLAGRLASTGNAAQVITVEAPIYDTTYATLTLWQRQGHCWVTEAGPWPARIGTKGFSNHHTEGDGTTPAGSYAIGPVMYGNAPNPGVHYAYHRLTCGDWWDEYPLSKEYNTFQHVACAQTPAFAPGSEALWTETNAYPSFAVVEYNSNPVVRGAGSGIFVHANIGFPTAGCVSVPLADLDTLLRALRPADAPRIVMGPASEIDRF